MDTDTHTEENSMHSVSKKMEAEVGVMGPPAKEYQRLGKKPGTHSASEPSEDPSPVKLDSGLLDSEL